MAWTRLAFALVLATAMVGSATTSALAEGTWPADVDLSTSTASPGDAVSFTGTIDFPRTPQFVESQSCLVELDGVRLSSPDCAWDEAGSIAGRFDVPDDLATEATVPVAVCWPDCLDDSSDDVGDYWQANTDLEIVAAPTTPPTTPTTPPTGPTTSLPTDIPTPVDTDQEQRADSDLPLAKVALALVAVLVLLLAAGLLARALRGRRDAKWVREHVTVSTRSRPGPSVDTRPKDGGDRDHIITVVADEVHRSTAVEEKPS